METQLQSIPTGQLVEAFETALAHSNASFGIADALLIAGAIVAGILVSFFLIGFFLYKFFWRKQNNIDKMAIPDSLKKDVKKANEAHELITHKNLHGMYVFLHMYEMILEIFNDYKKSHSR